MIAVVMAGGMASRFGGGVEKALLVVGGASLLERAVKALQLEELDEVAVATSPHTPATAEEARRLGVRIVETKGLGYHQDVTEMLEEHDVFLTLNVDVPFITKDHVRRLLAAHDGGSVAAVVDMPSSESSSDSGARGTCPDGRRFVWVGLNIVTDNPETKTVLFDEPLLAININDEQGLARARAIALERGV